MPKTSRNMSVVSAIFVGLLAVAAGKEKLPSQYTIPLPPKPDYSALEWLIGEWSGRTTDRSAPGEVRWSFSYDLDKQFLVLRGEVSLAATKMAPASKESWMGILSAGRGQAGYVLRTFSSTGFISRYRVTVDGAEIRFTPEGGEEPPPGWLFRRLIQRTEAGGFIESVEAAPPGKAFFAYYTARLRRVAQPGASAQAPGSTK